MKGLLIKGLEFPNDSDIVIVVYRNRTAVVGDDVREYEVVAVEEDYIHGNPVWEEV